MTGSPHFPLRVADHCSSGESLVGNQQAALARLLYAVRQPGGCAVLCGPGGTGVTTVLGRLAAALEQAGHPVLRLSGRNLAGGELSVWADGLATDATVPPAVLVDDGHAAADGALTALLHQCGEAVSATAIVLAGQGRLLTLLARERDLAGRVQLRAVLRALTREETEAVVSSRLAAAGVGRYEAGVPSIIHAITAGIPQAICQLLETVLLVAAARPEHQLCCEDIERMHDRLSLAAA